MTPEENASLVLGTAAIEKRRKALDENFEIGQFYENAQHTKFQITELNERFVMLTELTGEGKRTAKNKKFTRAILAGLIEVKSFEQTRFGRREAYLDLRELEVGKLFNK
ncbi:MAG: hypothetical protein WC979_00295 [Candidatus Pacearchaeota archaeon]|jgi:hypothetical protein|nr:hypothetical protein [Clostridia bacterium]